MKRLAGLFRGEGYKARTGRTSLLTLANIGTEYALRLGGNLVLTRILFPEAFGLMALVQVFVTGLSMFSDLGVRASIVQNPRGTDPLFLDTAWVLQILRGVTLWIGACLLAAPMAAFYEAPMLAELLPVAALSAVIQGLRSTKLATANREMRMGLVVISGMISRVAGMAVLIALALILESVWALAIGGLVAPMLITLSSHLVLPGHSNRLRFDLGAARELVNFGKFILISTLAGFLVSHADRAILGKFITLSDLALYNIAFMFASLPLMVARRLNHSVLFPLYSRLPPQESAENARNVRRARGLIVGAALMLTGVMGLVGNELIIVLYDPRFEAAGPLAVLIAVGTIPLVLINSYEGSVLAAGRSDRFAGLLILLALLRTAALFLGIYTLGVFGAALAPLLAVAIYYIPLVRMVRDYGLWLPLQDLAFAAVGAALAAVAIWANLDALLAAWPRFGPG